MSIDDIRMLRSARPFKPFDMVLRDRKRVHVALPERLAVTPNGEKLGIYEDIMPALVDASNFALFQPPGPVEIVDPIHVVFAQYYE